MDRAGQPAFHTQAAPAFPDQPAAMQLVLSPVELQHQGIFFNSDHSLVLAHVRQPTATTDDGQAF